MLNSNIKVGIIGLGLIGGSLAKILAQKNYSLVGVSRSDSTINKARELNIFDKVSDKVDDVNGCDVIFVCTPINMMGEMFRKLNEVMTNTCIISDVASIKADIADLGNDKFTSEFITFIPGHPMAGTEKQGIDYAFPTLFNQAKWVICPIDPSKKKEIGLLSQIIKDSGANIIYCNPHIHDLSVALISHMPLLISMSLVDSVDSLEDFILKENAFYLAASGFRDTTRIAGGNPELTHDMLNLNKKNVLKALEMFECSLAKLKKTLNNDKQEAMDTYSELSEVRQKLYSELGSNVFKGLSG